MSDHGALEGDPQVISDGKRWFFIVGPIAILFAYFLYCVDERLNNWNREQVLADTLEELRTAQTHLDSRVTDQRILHPGLYGSKTVGELAAETHDDGDSEHHPAH